MNCPFCSPAAVLLANDLAFVVADRFPVSPGHKLVVAYRHAASWFDLSPAEQRAMIELANEARLLCMREAAADGFNLGVNVGTAAGQTIAHAHLHVIPRYDGDVEEPRGGVRGVIPGKRSYP